MSSKRDERVALPVVASEFTLTPSTYTTGALPSDSDDGPRMRMLDPPPAAPAEMICTPAACPESSCPSELAVVSCALAAMSTDATVFAISAFFWAPVTVTTTSTSENAACAIVASCGGCLTGSDVHRRLPRLVADAVELDGHDAGGYAANGVAAIVAGLAADLRPDDANADANHRDSVRDVSHASSDRTRRGLGGGDLTRGDQPDGGKRPASPLGASGRV